MLPTINITGYQGVSTNADGGLETTNFQVQSSVTNVMGKHTLAAARPAWASQGRIDGRGQRVVHLHLRQSLYTGGRHTSVFPASNIGLGLASLMLGIPTQVSIGRTRRST